MVFITFSFFPASMGYASPPPSLTHKGSDETEYNIELGVSEGDKGNGEFGTILLEDATLKLKRPFRHAMKFHFTRHMYSNAHLKEGVLTLTNSQGEFLPVTVDVRAHINRIDGDYLNRLLEGDQGLPGNGMEPNKWTFKNAIILGLIGRGIPDDRTNSDITYDSETGQFTLVFTSSNNNENDNNEHNESTDP